MKKGLIYVNWLNHVYGFGRKKLKSVFEIYGSGREVWELKDDEREKIWRLHVEKNGRCALKEKDIRAIGDFKRVISPQRLWQSIKEKGIRVLDEDDPEYPVRLLNIPDRPIILYMISGKDDRPAGIYRPSVAVVGSRICSEYGRMVANRIGRLCGQMDIELISGMAVGIDGIAQRAAIEAGGLSTAVLGSGVDVCYPRENKELYVNLKTKGRILSEFVPGMQPKQGNFPLRNRIISGLADAVIVVEAREKSGTMITVDMALEQGRQVYIIPGRLTDPLSAGCNRLISQGAEIIWNLTETMERIAGERRREQYLKQHCGTPRERVAKTQAEDSLSEAICSVLDYYPRTLQTIYDEVVKLTEISFQELQMGLLELEMMGVAAQEGGRYFIKGRA